MGAVRYLFLLAVLAVVGYAVYDYQIRDLTQAPEPETSEPTTVGETLEKAADEMIEAALPQDEPAPTRFLKWTDDDGIVHYTNDPESIPERFRGKTSDVMPSQLMIEVSTSSDDTPPVAGVPTKSQTLDASAHGQLQDVPTLRVPDDDEVANERRARTPSDIPTTVKESSGILLYTTEWCDECVKTRHLLETSKVPFVALDVEKDVRHLRDMLELTGGKGRVPVLKAGKAIVIGYKPEAILFAVDKAKR